MAAASNFQSLGEEFCWHARSFAFIYGDDHVDAHHLLLAAAEVTPTELHGFEQLTTKRLARALEALHVGAETRATCDSHPEQLSPDAVEIVKNVIRFASATKRAPTLRDLWAALSMVEHGTVPRLLDNLGVEPKELFRRVSGS